MGDLIEFKSWPRHQHIFYKITSGAVSFYVKETTMCHAAVGLARRPGDCAYWVVFGQNKGWVEKADSSRSNVTKVPNLLTRQMFTSLWISWHGGRIQFGRTSDGIPLISKETSVQDMQYVTFSTYADRGLLYWKLFLPPKLEKPLFKKVAGGDMKWVNTDQRLPPGVLIGGHENEMLYIIRASHHGSLTPGKFVPSQGLGFIPWGGDSHEKDEFEVLCGYNCKWVSTYGNRIPVGAIEGGYSENTNETLFIGRAVQGQHLIPGKVQPSHSVCYIPYNDNEVAKDKYEILVNPEISMHSSNQYYAIDKEQSFEPPEEIDIYDNFYMNDDNFSNLESE